MTCLTIKQEVNVDVIIVSVVDQNGDDLYIKEAIVDRYGEITVKVHVDYPEDTAS